MSCRNNYWRYVVSATLFITFQFSGCGFHLRGTETIEMGSAIDRLQIRTQGSQQDKTGLLAAMKNAVRIQTKIQIEDTGDAPRLILFDEKSESRVLSVTQVGKVDEYLLKYELSFRLEDKAGNSLAPPQTVRVQRDHQFDRLNVLAKEREEVELRREMQRDAVQQILRRLSRIKLNS